MLTSATPIFENVPATFADPVGLADQQAQRRRRAHRRALRRNRGGAGRPGRRLRCVRVRLGSAAHRRPHHARLSVSRHAGGRTAPVYRAPRRRTPRLPLALRTDRRRSAPASSKPSSIRSA